MADIALSADLFRCLFLAPNTAVDRLSSCRIHISNSQFDRIELFGRFPCHLRAHLCGAIVSSVLFSTVTVALIVTVAGVLLGYPIAFAMARLNKRWAFVVAACVFIPLWTSILIRSYAWIVLLQRNGLVNSLLETTGVTEQPVKMLYTQGAVILAMTHVLLPFVILPIFSVLRTLPTDYVRAARNLGAGAVVTFLRITFPLSLPGVFAGATICFVLALGFYITPALVGGPGSMLMPTLIGQQTTVVVDWPFAAALSTVLLVMTLVFIALLRKALSFQKGFSNVH